MSNIYKMTLSPIEWYFFGGEQTYGGASEVNYYAKSNLFPQESAIVGMLRYEILKKQNLLDSDDKEAVVRSVGPWGFNPTSIDKQEMGLLKGISPVMIQDKDGDICTRAPLDNGVEVSFVQNENVYINGSKSALPVLNEPMKRSAHEWISCTDGAIKKGLSDNDIFDSTTKIGIIKSTDHIKGENDESYHKGDLYTLREGFSFVFFAQMDIELEDGLVQLGAERSMFKMTVELVDEDKLKTLHELWNGMKFSSQSKIVLFSEAFVSEEVYRHCSFAITETIPFRCIVRPWRANHNYASLDMVKERSARFNLLKRGSVLYYETESQKTEIERLINIPYLMQYGYNQSSLLITKR